MKDLKQIKLISESLENEKKKYLNELMKITSAIENKLLMIQKMVDYKSDYFSDNNFKISKSVPGLNKNINLFVKKIDDVVQKTYAEIENLKKMRTSLLETVAKIDQKLDVMTIFEGKSREEIRQREEKQEQLVTDDIVSTIDLRREDD